MNRASHLAESHAGTHALRAEEVASDGSRPNRRAVIWSCVILASVSIVLLAVLGSYAYLLHGGIGVAAAATAVGLCWLGATAALLCVGLADTSQAVFAQLGGMALRLGLPVVAGLTLNYQVAAFAEVGFFTMVLVSYLIILLVETLLSVRLINVHSSGSHSETPIRKRLAGNLDPEERLTLRND